MKQYSCFLVSNDWFDRIYPDDEPTLIKSIRMHGQYNWYVSVPNTSSLYGKTYDRVDRVLLAEPWFNVHGWLTYWSHLNKATPLIQEAYIRTNEDHHLSDDVWIFWFDTLHFWDSPKEWDLQHCLEHVRNLKEYMEFIWDEPIEPDRDTFESVYEDELKNVKDWLMALIKVQLMDYLRGHKPKELMKEDYLANKENIIKKVNEIIKQFPLVNISVDDFDNDQTILEVWHDVYGFCE